GRRICPRLRSTLETSTDLAGVCTFSGACSWTIVSRSRARKLRARKAVPPARMMARATRIRVRARMMMYSIEIRVEGYDERCAGNGDAIRHRHCQPALGSGDRRLTQHDAGRRRHL